MSSYLLRDDAPLTAGEWHTIDQAVVSTARRQLVGRRLAEIFGPLGPGTINIHHARYTGRQPAAVSLIGEQAAGPVQAEHRLCQPLPMVYSDFVLYWRDIEWSRSGGTSLDVGAATAAAAALSRQEDELIFNGCPGCGLEGLFTVTGRRTVSLGDWEKPGEGFRNILEAVSELVQSGYNQPFALVLSPKLYGQLHRVYDGTGVLEVDQVRSVLGGGKLHPSPVVQQKAALLALGRENFDLVVGQDMVTAYLAAEQMNHYFRVFETISPRIKQPEAICTIE